MRVTEALNRFSPKCSGTGRHGLLRLVCRSVSGRGSGGGATAFALRARVCTVMPTTMATMAVAVATTHIFGKAKSTAIPVGDIKSPQSNHQGQKLFISLPPPA